MDRATEQAVRARMDQAHETLKEAEVLFEQDLWRGTINRSYYGAHCILVSMKDRRVITAKFGTLRTQKLNKR